jgi:hypothetical protein
MPSFTAGAMHQLDLRFAQADRVNIDVGMTGMVGLVAYTGEASFRTFCGVRVSLRKRMQDDCMRCRGHLFSPEQWHPQWPDEWRPYDE